MRGGADAILEGRDDLLLAVRARGEPLVRAGARREAPRGVRTREQTDLDLRVGGLPRHLVELGIGLHEDAGALRHAMDANVEPLRLCEHRLETARALGGRDLDPVLRAVRKPLRRVGQLVQIPARKPGVGEKAANRVHTRV